MMKLVEKLPNVLKGYVASQVIGSLEHKVLRVSYCDSAVSVVRHATSIFYLVYALSHIFSPIIMKLSQNICLVEISDQFKNGSCWVKN